MGRAAGLTRRALPGLLLLPAAARAAAAFEDHMPDFWRHYAPEGPPELRGRALIDRFFQPKIELMRGAGIGRVDLVRWLAAFDPIAPAVRRLSEAMPAAWAEAVRRFARVLPDFAPEAPVQAMVSFLWFDARVRPWRGRASLFLGLDGVVAFNGAGTDPGVLLAHECFHLYHHQVNAGLVLPGGDPLWLGIWKEGLAVHASAVLHPEASRVAVLLGERVLAEASPELVRRMAREALPVLGATEGAARAPFLAYGHRGALPQRGGYLLGLLVAERLGTDLMALARVPMQEAERLVRSGLERLQGG